MNLPLNFSEMRFPERWMALAELNNVRGCLKVIAVLGDNIRVRENQEGWLSWSLSQIASKLGSSADLQELPKEWTERVRAGTSRIPVTLKWIVEFEKNGARVVINEGDDELPLMDKVADLVYYANKWDREFSARTRFVMLVDNQDVVRARDLHAGDMVVPDVDCFVHYTVHHTTGTAVYIVSELGEVVKATHQPDLWFLIPPELHLTLIELENIIRGRL